MAIASLRKIIFGSTILLGNVLPAILPEIPLFNIPKVHAQEIKRPEEILEERIQREIDSLAKKEEKTNEEYARLINLSYDFKKERTLEYAKKAQEKTEENSPENTYAKAMVAWLTQPQDEKNEALALLEEILNNKDASNRLKSNAKLHFSAEQTKENAEEAITLDRTNLAAYLTWLEKNDEELINFINGLKIIDNQVILPIREECLLNSSKSSIINKYDYACRQKNANKKYSLTVETLVKIDEITIKTLERIRSTYLSAGLYNIVLERGKEIDKVYKHLTQEYPTYETHTRRGIFNYLTRPLRPDEIFISLDLQAFDIALKAFQAAEKLAITEKQKSRARLYQGWSIWDKGRYTIQTNKRLVRQGMSIVRECMTLEQRKDYFTPEEIEKAKSSLGID